MSINIFKNDQTWLDDHPQHTFETKILDAGFSHVSTCLGSGCQAGKKPPGTFEWCASGGFPKWGYHASSSHWTILVLLPISSHGFKGLHRLKKHEESPMQPAAFLSSEVAKMCPSKMEVTQVWKLISSSWLIFIFVFKLSTLSTFF